jgi:outer membrane protein assembly factor BamB
MSSQGGWGVPGHGSLVETYETELFWGGDNAKGLVLFKNAVISGATRDAGNTPTTLLRGGLLLGVVDASGEHEEWDADATDGTQEIRGILTNEMRAQDFDGNNADRVFRVAVRGPVKATSLLIQGAALVGHADEYLARRQLHLGGFILDDDPHGYKAGINPRTLAVAANTTVTAAQNGTIFFQTQAGATTFTLPAIKAGLRYTFISLVDQNMIVTSAAGDDIIVENDVAADTITFSTSSKKMGAQLTLAAEYANGTLKWVKQSQPGFTETPAT